MKKILIIAVVTFFSTLMSYSQNYKFESNKVIILNNFFGTINIIGCGSNSIKILKHKGRELPNFFNEFEQKQDNTGVGLNMEEDDTVMIFSPSKEQFLFNDYKLSIGSGTKIVIKYDLGLFNLNVKSLEEIKSQCSRQLFFNNVNSEIIINDIFGDIIMKNTCGAIQAKTVFGNISCDDCMDNKMSSFTTMFGNIYFNTLSSSGSELVSNTISGTTNVYQVMNIAVTDNLREKTLLFSKKGKVSYKINGKEGERSNNNKVRLHSDWGNVIIESLSADSK